MDPFALSAFDYELPGHAIATEPATPRDSSRLLHLPRVGPLAHGHVTDLPAWLRPGDLLVFNTTQVIPARLLLRRHSGASIDCLALAPHGGTVEQAHRWTVLARNAQSVADGEELRTTRGEAIVFHRGEGAERYLSRVGPLLEVFEREGEVPLPPYIRKQRHESKMRSSDTVDYQSMFARDKGAVAAPTASLHFTPALLRACEQRGVGIAHVCLHVGAGTFLPVRQEHEHDVRAHAMHKESYRVPLETQKAVRHALKSHRRVVPVGTTSLRALETWAASGEAQGESQLFVVPGYPFRVTSALVTNFHTPKSTLLMLVSALAGRDRLLHAYAQALAHHYRFLSYGDAMLLEAQQPAGGLASDID